MSETVGQVLKRLREDRKLSKSRLSREAGVSDAYIVQIEKGDRSPSETVLRRLAHVLRVPPHQLLVPAGFYLPEAVEDIERRAHEALEHAEFTGRELQPDLYDRLLAREYDELDALQHITDDEWASIDAQSAGRSEFDLPADVFWGWNKPLDVWPPEHWDKLTDSDRRMVQKLINRLMRSPDTEA